MTCKKMKEFFFLFVERREWEAKSIIDLQDFAQIDKNVNNRRELVKALIKIYEVANYY